ncbi:MAG: DUF3782 domain-containing protein [Chloroflexi bacterium]|nr:MAG: DUF3782 domain-containing protein [Chloroflexota bacterium]
MSVDLEKIREILREEIPRFIREHPETRHEIWGMMLELFPSRQETEQRFAQLEHRLDGVDRLETEVREFRRETARRFEQVDRRFEQVDQRFEQVDQRFEQVDRRLSKLEQRMDRLEKEMREGFQELHKAIDRLGSRWGIRNESVFRQTVKTLLEESFGAKVESRVIRGEQFDIVIADGQHILVEIAASVGPKIQERLERKRKLYADEVGVTPARVILVTAAIHSRRAQALREAGFEVIEPEEETLGEDL